MEDIASSALHHQLGGMSMVPTPSIKRPLALVVTPDAQIRKYCRDSILAAGLGIEVTESGVTALNLARSLLPDMILLDVELYDVHGLEVVTWLKSDPLLRHIPIIAFSAFAGDKHDPRAGNNGVRVMLSKPIRAKELDVWVKTTL